MLIQLISLLFMGLVPQAQDRPLLSSTPLERAVPAEDVELRVYDLSHLTRSERLNTMITEATHSHGMLAGSTDFERLNTIKFLREQVQSTTESISRAIQDMLEPAFDEDRNEIVGLGNGTLAIIASTEQHEWLARLIAHAAAFDGLIDVQVRIYHLDLGSLAEMGQERSGQVVSEARAEALREVLRSTSDGEIRAPRVLTYPFQRAELSVLEQQAYIQDFELKVVQDVEIADPVIGLAETGIRVRIRCIPIPEDKLSIDTHVEYSTLAEPIPSVETTIGAGAHKVTIQLPGITKINLEGRFEVLPGETLVMASTDPQGEQEVLVLVSATRVDDTTDEK
ncbi:MAG: hypothetical protein ACI8QZ_004409 [Chlamydiales bacterium]|jgi:hypothetical protein